MTALVTVRRGLVESVEGSEDVVIVNFDVTELSDPETVRDEIASMEDCRGEVFNARGPQWQLAEIDSCVSTLQQRLEPKRAQGFDVERS